MDVSYENTGHGIMYICDVIKLGEFCYDFRRRVNTKITSWARDTNSWDVGASRDRDVETETTSLLFAASCRSLQVFSAEFDRRKFTTLSDYPCLQHVGTVTQNIGTVRLQHLRLINFVVERKHYVLYAGTSAFAGEMAAARVSDATMSVIQEML